MNPKRIQRRRAKGWRMPAGAVYVGRPGPWGNPFIVGKHGTEARCVELFRLLVGGRQARSLDAECVKAQERFWKYAIDHWRELRGKDLACWCRPGRPCHADVLLELANAEGQGCRASRHTLDTLVRHSDSEASA